MKNITKVSQLIEMGLVDPEKRGAIEKVAEKFSISLTPEVIEMMQTGSERDKAAIAQQFVPSEQELSITASELKDPIGDDVYTQVKGIVHRNSDRCLLMPLLACPVYCRFCFRREKVGSNSKALSEEELHTALTYIAEHKELWEVILTGGDPLMLNPKKLEQILQALENIEHVEVIRIHTRVPIFDSNRITEKMIKSLKINKAVYVALHANHPSELTERAQKACARLIDAGIPMLSQTVLLKGINDTPEIMGKLMRALAKNRIKPYYLHHADLAEGTAHFRTTVKEGQELMKSLRSQYSGLCQPTYVLDIPGGFGKVPIGDSYFDDGMVEDYHGNFHQYD
jgi:lysine 2,3-aminomutase